MMLLFLIPKFLVLESCPGNSEDVKKIVAICRWTFGIEPLGE